LSPRTRQLRRCWSATRASVRRQYRRRGAFD
jgi:hypothetical protein